MTSQVLWATSNQQRRVGGPGFRGIGGMTPNDSLLRIRALSFFYLQVVIYLITQIILKLGVVGYPVFPQSSNVILILRTSECDFISDTGPLRR